MAKSFKNLIKKMPADRQKRIEHKTKQLKNQMALAELRQAQKQLADALEMNQAAISKFEHQSDFYISTLRKVLSAMGAELQIVARFPETDVVIDQFAGSAKKTAGVPTAPK